MNPTSLLHLVIGLVLLLIGAETLVRGASRLAARLGIPAVIIGLTVVSFGTSAPELAISLQSAFSNQGDIAVGNAIGSNILNVLLVLGLSSAISPLVITQRLVRLDVPIMIGASLALFWMARDGRLDRTDGFLLVLGLLAFIFLTIRQSTHESQAVLDEYNMEFGQDAHPARLIWVLNLLMILIGLGMLVLGANWLVNGAVAFAEAMGVSQVVIGLTVVAVGTGAPEIATSLIASLRGERDIAVGNVVGSNLFNILGVLGPTALAAPAGLPIASSIIRFDLPVMLATAFACLPIFYIGNKISRWEGVLFLGYYAAYMAYLLLDAAQHDALPTFSRVMLEFIVPLTVVTLAIFVIREFQAQRAIKR